MPRPASRLAEATRPPAVNPGTAPGHRDRASFAGAAEASIEREQAQARPTAPPGAMEGDSRQVENWFRRCLERGGFFVGYLSEFIALIERLRKCAETHKEYLANNEAATRACLVDPVLRILGWDVSDPEQVRVEYKVEGKSADYALLRDGKPHILIEAKSLGAKIKEDFWQLAVYAARTGAALGVMTNGDEWVFLDPTDTSRPKRASVKLLSQEIRSLTLDLVTHLDAAEGARGPDPEPPSGSGDEGDIVPLLQLETRLKAVRGSGNKLHLRYLVCPDGRKLRLDYFTYLILRAAEEAGPRLRNKLPLFDAEGHSRYVVADTDRHPDGKPFRAIRDLGGVFVELGRSNAALAIRNAIHILRTAGLDPAGYKVELA